MSKKYGGVRLSESQVPSQLNTAFQGSDIICLRIYSRVIVVLCSLSAIKDLLEKRGQNYSFRHPPPISEMYSCSVIILISRYVDKLRSLGWRWIGPYSQSE
ncbi:hypothetical protein BJV77DRAFT_319574 [Russula vinacea]|nr:hypothetical protein BJV77DRAFT_319574 [Russula vinacea]